jgi:hypothetical protein
MAYDIANYDGGQLSEVYYNSSKAISLKPEFHGVFEQIIQSYMKD